LRDHAGAVDERLLNLGNFVIDAGDVFRLFTPTGFGVPGQFVRLKDWLDAGSYVPVGSVDDKSFKLRAHSPSDLTGALTEEFCASALSAFESMIEVERGARVVKALAWPSIKAYYSSFFSAHAFMRFFGTGCTWLAGSDLQRLKSVAQLHQVLVGTGPKRGQWIYKVGFQGEIEFKLGGATQGGGAHDVVWDAFVSILDEVMTKLASSSLVSRGDAQAIVMFLDSLKADCKSGAPSSVRNGVNYRRDYGVWFPYTGFDRKFETLMKRSASWRTIDCLNYRQSASLPELSRMFNFSYAMASLCLLLSKASAKYFDNHGRRFASGPLKLVASQ
jgi:hypothetical protein